MKAESIKRDLEVIEELGWKAEKTASYLGISPETIRDAIYRKASTKRTSVSKTRRIAYFRSFLSELKEGGVTPSEETVESITILPGKTFSKFIKEYYSESDELIRQCIHTSVEAFLASRLRIDFRAEFEKRYKFIGEETIAQAAEKDPQFLAEFIAFGKIKPLTRAIALSKLGHSHNDSYLGLLKTFTKDEAPLVREGAYQGLAEYFFYDEKKYADLMAFFKQSLNNETGPGVQKQIRSLIDAMELYQE